MSDDDLHRLVRLYHGPLVAHVRSRIKSGGDAEDIVQETWIRAGRALSSRRVADGDAAMPAISNMRAFLYRIAGNLSIDHLRRLRVRGHIEHPLDDQQACEIAADAPLAEAILIARQQEAAFEAALKIMSPRMRRVLLLHRIEQRTYPQIAAELGISPRTVFSDLEKALAFCMAALASGDA